MEDPQDDATAFVSLSITLSTPRSHLRPQPQPHPHPVPLAQQSHCTFLLHVPFGSCKTQSSSSCPSQTNKLLLSYQSLPTPAAPALFLQDHDRPSRKCLAHRHHLRVHRMQISCRQSSGSIWNQPQENKDHNQEQRYDLERNSWSMKRSNESRASQKQKRQGMEDDNDHDHDDEENDEDDDDDYPEQGFNSFADFRAAQSQKLRAELVTQGNLDFNNEEGGVGQPSPSDFQIFDDTLFNEDDDDAKDYILALSKSIDRSRKGRKRAQTQAQEQLTQDQWYRNSTSGKTDDSKTLSTRTQSGGSNSDEADSEDKSADKLLAFRNYNQRAKITRKQLAKGLRDAIKGDLETETRVRNAYQRALRKYHVNSRQLEEESLYRGLRTYDDENDKPTDEEDEEASSFVDISFDAQIKDRQNQADLLQNEKERTRRKEAPLTPRYSRKLLYSFISRHRNIQKLEEHLSSGNLQEAVIHFKNTYKTPGYSTRQFNGLLNAVVKSRVSYLAQDLFEFYNDNSPSTSQPDVASYVIMISMYAKRKHVAAAEALIEQMKAKNITPNAFVYSALIDALGRCGEIDHCRQTFRNMDSNGVVPNIVAYNAFMKALCRNNMVGEAFDLLAEMRKVNRGPDTYTYGTLIDVCGKTGQLHKSLDLLRRMNSDNISPSRVCYSAIINAYGKRNQVEKAFSMFREMKRRNIEPDLFTYNALIDACGRNKMSTQAFEVYNELVENGVAPDRVTFNSLICASGRNGDLKNAFFALDQMTRGFNIKPDVGTYNILIDACGKTGRIDRAMDLYRNMQKTLKPSLFTYNALIDACGRARDLNLALDLMKELLSRYEKPDLYIINTMISTCFKCKALEQGQKFYNQLGNFDLTPDEITFNTLIDGHSRLGSSMRDVWKCYQEMLNRSIKPSYITLCTLAKAAENYRHAQSAAELIKEVDKYEISWTSPLASWICSGLLEGGELHQAGEFEKRIRNMGVHMLFYVNSKMLDRLLGKNMISSAKEYYQRLSSKEKEVLNITVQQLLS